MVKYRRECRKEIVNLNEKMKDPLNRWMAWFDLSSPPDLVAEVIRMDSAILRAEEKQNYVISDEDALHIYEMRQKAIRDRLNIESHAREEGREEGRIETARKALAKGCSPELIHDITGLEIEAIRNIQAK